MKASFALCDKVPFCVTSPPARLAALITQDGDGEITKQELAAVMKDLGVTFTPQELQTMFLQLDVGA